ncbi:hypothetical protein ACFWVC_32540 [Streptomyces sp. NPDC058691]|uniref:hypothetical protein n=1 Tax=Streptomyces sp. NPDC058691 TaxID=3346601 RepID=UPI0036555367
MTEAGAVQATAEPTAEAASGPASGPEGPQPLGVVVEATGNTEVDGVLVRLEDADALPTEDHIEVYEDVHRGLRDALTRLDDNRS